MSQVTSGMVRDLRERTGAGMMDCKKALSEMDGNVEKAMVFLREKGLAAAAKRSGRSAAEGQVASYIHAGGKIGVLIEVNCETDFVARTDDFEGLVKAIAMQVAAASPRYLDRDEVPAPIVEQERSIFAKQAAESGKPERVIEKIVTGKIEKFYSEVCLLEQPFIKDPDKKIGDLVADAVAKLGENVVVRRFARFQLGDDSRAEA